MVGELLEINCLLKLSLLSTQGALAVLVFISKGKRLGHWKIIHAAEGKSRHVKKKMLPYLGNNKMMKCEGLFKLY